MVIQRTLSIIKPDATKRNVTGKINQMLESSGLRIVAQKRIKLDKEKAEGFYAIHKDKSFFNELIDYMTSEPVVVQVLQGENAVEKYRKIMGATNPQNADSGTIRKEFALNIQENSVHGSDSNENAKLEIDYFFNKNEIITKNNEKIIINIIATKIIVYIVNWLKVFHVCALSLVKLSFS